MPTVNTKELVTTIAYLIGIKIEVIEQQFESPERLALLQGNQDATIIRYLCKLRTTLFHKFKPTDTALRYDLKNLDSLEWYDRSEIRQLQKWEVPVIQVNTTASSYMQLFCKLINERFDKCKPLFPEWIKWSYVRELFCIPKYTQATSRS